MCVRLRSRVAERGSLRVSFRERGRERDRGRLVLRNCDLGMLRKKFFPFDPQIEQIQLRARFFFCGIRAGILYGRL